MFYKDFFSLCGRLFLLTTLLCGSGYLCIAVDSKFVFLTLLFAALTPLEVMAIVLKARSVGSQLVEPLSITFNFGVLIASSLLMLAGFAVPILIELSDLWRGLVGLPFFMMSCSLQSILQLVMRAQYRTSATKG